MLPSLRAITVVSAPRLPGSLSTVTWTRPTCVVASPSPVSQATSIQRSGVVGELFQRLAVDGVDGHALAGGDDADDAVARQRMAAAGEVQRHARDQAADGDAPRLAGGLRRLRASGTTFSTKLRFLRMPGSTASTTARAVK